MMPVEKLPEVTEKVLSGLKADDRLKHKIYDAALSGSPRSLLLPRNGLVTVSCCLALAAAVAFWGIHGGLPKRNEADSAFPVFSSASHTGASPVFLHEFLSP